MSAGSEPPLFVQLVFYIGRRNFTRQAALDRKKFKRNCRELNSHIKIIGNLFKCFMRQINIQGDPKVGTGWHTVKHLIIIR